MTEASFEAVAMLIKKYLDFAENSQITISSKVNDLITQIKSKINIDYNSKMLDLKEQNANLNQQLKTYEKQINILIEENNKLKIKDTKQRHELNEKTNELKDLEKNKKIRENKIQKLIFNNNHLNKLLERNQNILDKTNANYTALENKINKTKEIEKNIINQLYNNPTTLNNIVLELYKKNYKLTTKEIYSIIKNIKDIDIDETFYDNNLIFNIRTPKISTNAVLDFGYINNYILNILVTADYHIGLDNFKRRQKEVDLLLCVNDYCETNDIDFIINLGDVVSIKEKNRENTFSNFSYIKEMLDFLVNNYPEVLNTQQIILGGNHDEIFVRSGIDFLEKLTNQRSDLTLVGYNHAFIKLGNSFMALHHPRNRFGCYNSVRYDLINYLKDYYKNSAINFNEVCFNLLGHTHKYNIINDYKSIIQCHGFYVDKSKNNVYFDLIVDFEEKNKEQIKDEVERRIKEKYPSYNYNIILDSDITD